eukprot:SAG11_NODE_19768_length_459_cov_0.858333_1_plen_37_part_01
MGVLAGHGEVVEFWVGEVSEVVRAWWCLGGEVFWGDP